MSTETIEIFNNSDEWANQLKHALSKGENLALLHGLTPDILVDWPPESPDNQYHLNK
ncbi:hypothetical protein JV477_002419 [Escherichia coli]|nr:hypothetical protein [Escherichia coli]